MSATVLGDGEDNVGGIDDGGGFGVGSARQNISICDYVSRYFFV